MTRTTRRRLVVLALAVTSVAAAVGGAFYYHDLSVQRKLREARNAGMAFYHQGRYPDALGQLSRYIAKNQTDTPALLAYARARIATEEPDGRNITEGIGVLRRYLDLVPDDPSARAQLLDLYTRAGYANEALQLADRLLAARPDDPSALRARYISLARLRKFQDSLATLDRYLAITPADLSAQSDRLDLLDALSAPPQAAIDHARSTAALLGDSDPRAHLITALAQTFALDPAAAEVSLRKAVDLAFSPPSSSSDHSFTLGADFVTRCADLFDRLHLYADAQKLVDRAATANASDADLAYALASRLWAAGNYPAVVDRTAAYVPQAAPHSAGAKSPEIDRAAPTRLLALRALALYQLDRPSEAAVLQAALSRRDDDPLAVAWSVALGNAFPPDHAAITPLTPLARRQNYLSALARARGTRDPLCQAVLSHLLAGTSRDLGESELAVAHWRDACRLLPQWSTPYRLLTQTLLDTADPGAARQVAAELVRRSPTLDNVALLCDAWSRALAAAPTDAPADPPPPPTPASASPDTLPLPSDTPLTDTASGTDAYVRFVTSAFNEAGPDPRLLPARVSADLLAGRRDAAVALLTASLADKALLPDVRAALVDLAARSALPLDLSPTDTADFPPELVLRLALRDNAQGRPDVAKSRLTLLSDKHPSPESALAICRYLDLVADPNALATFRQLVEKCPDRHDVRLAVVTSRAAWADRAFVNDSIDRLHALTGDDGLHWRIARARLLLTPGDPAAVPGDKDNAEAVNLLSSVVSVTPRLVAPRILLARALMPLDAGSAVEQLSAALSLASPADKPAIALELAPALVDRRKTDAALAVLRSVAASPSLSLSQRLAVADQLSQLGDRATALTLLSSAPAAASAGDPLSPGAPSPDTLSAGTFSPSALASLLAAPASSPQAASAALSSHSSADALLTQVLSPSRDPRLARDIAIARLLAADPARRADAVAAYARLVDNPHVGLAVSLEAADFFARSRSDADLAAARRIVEKALAPAPNAATPAVPPDIADTVRAFFEQSAGNPDRAVALLRQVVARNAEAAASPRSSSDASLTSSVTLAAHAQLAVLLLRQNQLADAQAVISAGLALAPGDPTLTALAAARDLLSLLAPYQSLRGVAQLVAINPADPATADLRNALTFDGKSVVRLPAEPTINALRALTTRRPAYLPGHAALLRALLEADQPTEVSKAATRLFYGALPSSPLAARVAVTAFLDADNPQAALGVATRWRELTPDNPIPADIAIASAHLALSHTAPSDAALSDTALSDARSAVQQLARYFAPETTLLSPPPSLSLTWLGSLVATGDSARALPVALTLFRDPALRTDVLDAIVPGREPAPPALTAAQTLLPALEAALTNQDPSDDRIRTHLARAWYRLAGSNPVVAADDPPLEVTRIDDPAIVNADRLLESVPAPHRATPDWHILAASVATTRDDLPLAEREYRAALTLVRDSDLIGNNLADVLVRLASADSDPARRTARAKEALELASRAAQRRPSVSQFHDTLARAQLLLGQTDAALASFDTACKLAPDHLDSLLSYAGLLASTGKSRQAAAIVRDIDSRITPASPLPRGLRSHFENLKLALRDSL